MTTRASPIDVYFETAQSAVALLDGDATVVRVNAQLAAITGLPLEAHVGRRLSEILPRFDAIPALEAAVLGLGRASSAIDDMYVTGERTDRLGGRRRWRASLRVIDAHAGHVLLGLRDETGGAPASRENTADHARQDAADRAARHLAFLYTVTESLQGASLEESARLELAARLAVPDLADVCVITLVDDVEDARRVAVAHWDPVRAKQLADLLLGPIPRARIRAVPEAAVLETGRTIHYERLRDDDPLAVHLGARSWVVAPLPRGVANGAILFAYTESTRRYEQQDITLLEEFTRRVAVATENARLFAEAVASARSRDELLSMVSHDVRNPLQSLHLRASVMLDKLDRGDVPREELIKAFQAVSRNVEQANSLLDDVLAASTIERGVALEITDVDLVSVVEDVCGNAADRAAQVGSEIVVDVASGPGPIIGQWDRLRLEQIFTNLLSNAIKYGNRKPITITLGANDRVVRFAVRDQGIGIDPSEHARIFERFGRATAVQRSKSYGIGLWIVRRLVRAMGGSVTLDSALGRGSTFAVDLPRHWGRIDPPEPVPLVGTGSLRGRTILLVDDDVEHREAMRDLLELEGCVVVDAPNGERALEAMRTRPLPDVVILDIQMPGLTGSQTYEAMQAGARTANLPVLFCSSAPQEAPPNVERIRKPVNLRELRAALIGLLRS